MARVGIFLIVIALIAGMVGCGGGGGGVIEYYLTISSTDGGDVTTPGEGVFAYDVGTVVSLNATPDIGYQFVNWTGDINTIANINSRITTITLHGHYSITANFEQIPPGQFALTVFSTSGGSVTVPGESTFIYQEGAVVELVATPDVSYHFVNWTGDVYTIQDINLASTTINMQDNYEITANFAIDTYNLTVISTADGSVTDPGQGTFTYAAGTVVSLVATPAGCCGFVNWTGDTDTIASANASSTTITMNNHYSITANFQPFPPEGVPIVCEPPIAPGNQTYSISTPQNPRPTQVVLNPLDVNKCAWQEVTVWARDLVGNPIYQVIGEGRTNSMSVPFTLSLIGGTETDGIWRGYWYNEDDYCINYQVAINVTSASGTNVLELTFK